jgi:hypothetical protein
MRSPAVTAPPGRAGSPGRLLAVNVTACLLLLVQYLLGMAVNLFVTLPGRHPARTPATTSPARPPASAG